jgi:hypothetical protein
MSGNSSAAIGGDILGPKGLHVNSGFAWFGSCPTFLADQVAFEPNFRHFDIHLPPSAVTVPDKRIVETVWKVPEGEAHWTMSTTTVVPRTVPVLVPTIIGGVLVNWAVAKMLQRPVNAYRLNLIPCLLLCFAYHNFTKWYGREKCFQQAILRNQTYAMEEMRRKRDEQRVREFLYREQFTEHPVDQYRAKEWLTAMRFR